MSGINFVGEFELQEIKLTSVQGNILNFISDVNLVAVDIFENMFKTGITGSIVFADTNNFVENLPIIGQERLTFKAATPSFVNKEDIIDFTETPFIVYKIQKNEDLSANSNLVQLLFTSEENRVNLGLTGEEYFTILSISKLEPKKIIECKISKGKVDKKIKLLCRIDTNQELEYFKSGGILQYVLNKIVNK